MHYGFPHFKKYNGDLIGYINSKLNYPEDKSIAYELYNMDYICILYKVILDEEGKIETIDLFDARPENVDNKYKEEAIRAIKMTSGCFSPSRIVGRNVKSEIIIPVSFRLND